MRVRQALLGLLCATLLPALAHAVPVAYSGVLVSGAGANGSAGGFSWFLDDGARVSFWSFAANANDVVSLRVDRLAPLNEWLEQVEARWQRQLRAFADHVERSR